MAIELGTQLYPVDLTMDSDSDTDYEFDYITTTTQRRVRVLPRNRPKYDTYVSEIDPTVRQFDCVICIKTIPLCVSTQDKYVVCYCCSKGFCTECVGRFEPRANKEHISCPLCTRDWEFINCHDDSVPYVMTQYPCDDYTEYDN